MREGNKEYNNRNDIKQTRD